MGEPWMKLLTAAFMAMEPPNSFISLARQLGGGSITTDVQMYILEHCINNIGKENAYNRVHVTSILKKVIIAAESTSEDIADGLYEQFAHHMSLHTEDDVLKDKNKIYKQVSFLFSNGYDDINPNLADLVVSLECSLNILEGDTGCALWPSSLFLSELILSYPDTFADKICFEVGSGVGLVGISLIHIGASKVILSDGDESTLANMKRNLELNQLPSESKMCERTYVECEHLQWESPSKSKLQSYQPGIVLGADIIYDPLSIPHLIQVLSTLLGINMDDCVRRPSNITSHSNLREAPIAYIAQVIRNYETFELFLKQAEEAHLCVTDITETKRPHNLLPYMLSYDRSSVRLFRVSSARYHTS